MLEQKTRYGVVVKPLPENFGDYRKVGGNYGVETFRRSDPLVEWVLGQAKNLRAQGHHIGVEIGGASGFMAANLAKCGYDMVVIDCDDNSDWINIRNGVLSAENNQAGKPINGRLAFVRSEMQKVGESDLTECISGLFDGSRPSLFMSYFAFHFVDLKEINRWFKMASSVAARGAIFAVSCTLDSGCRPSPYWRKHDPEKIKSMAYGNGFKTELEVHSPNRTDVRWGFRLVRPNNRGGLHAVGL